MENKEIALLPYASPLLKAAEAYCQQMHLPIESMSSIIYTIDNWNKLNRIVERQTQMAPDERKRLVDTTANLAPQVMKVIDDYVEMHLIPYTSMTWVEGHPYPKAEGLRYKLRSDARVLKSIKTTRILEALSSDNPTMGYHCDIDFWNSEHYEADGYADLAELQTRRQRTKPPVSFMAMIAETRSVRRCTMKALGLPTGVAEDIQEANEVEQGTTEKIVIVQTEAKAKNEPDASLTRATFLTKAQVELGLTPEQVNEKLAKAGVPLEQVTDWLKAFQFLKENK